MYGDFTEEQLAALKGPKRRQAEILELQDRIGTNGTNGQDGYTPVRGTDYWTSSDIATIESYCANYIDENITQAIGGSY